MKHLLKPLLIVMMFMASGMLAMAQIGSGHELTREDLAAKQARYIARELALEAPVAHQYVETYCSFQRDLWKLGPRKGLTTEQRLDRSQRILNLRKKYNKLYSRFLTEPQLDKAYKLEKRLLNRMAKNRSKEKQHRRK